MLQFPVHLLLGENKLDSLLFSCVGVLNLKPVGLVLTPTNVSIPRLNLATGQYEYGDHVYWRSQRLTFEATLSKRSKEWWCSRLSVSWELGMVSAATSEDAYCEVEVYMIRLYKYVHTRGNIAVLKLKFHICGFIILQCFIVVSGNLYVIIPKFLFRLVCRCHRSYLFNLQ